MYLPHTHISQLNVFRVSVTSGDDGQISRWRATQLISDRDATRQSRGPLQAPRQAPFHFRGTLISSSENELLDSTNCSKGTLSGHKRMFTTFSTNPSTPIPTNGRVAAKPMYRTPTTATTPLPQARAQVQAAPVQVASAAVAAASNPLTNTTDDYERMLPIFR